MHLGVTQTRKVNLNNQEVAVLCSSCTQMGLIESSFTKLRIFSKASVLNLSPFNNDVTAFSVFLECASARNFDSLP
jgi:hypothetical protein